MGVLVTELCGVRGNAFFWRPRPWQCGDFRDSYQGRTLPL